MATVKDVQRAVATAFPEVERPAVFAALAKYMHGEFFHGPRVELAILALAQLAAPDERLAAVHRFVEAANLDPRDVLWGAEQPDERCSFTREELAEAYRRLGRPVPFREE